MKGKQMKKTISRVIIVILALLILTAVIFSVFVFLKARDVVNPKRKMLISDPSSVNLYFDAFETTNGENTIKGWYIPAQKSENETEESQKTIIFSHNYADNMEMNDISFLYFARFLAQNGYNIITFDYTGSGNSDGARYTLGQAEEIADLVSVIDYVKKTYPDHKLALFGWAFGAAAAISAAESQDIDIVISDSSYTDLSELLDESMYYMTGIDNQFFNNCVKLFLPFISSIDYETESPKDIVEKSSGKKFLFIHGENDDVISPDNAEILYSSATQNNEAMLYTIPDCPHIYGFMESEDNYKITVLYFLQEAFS